MDYNNMLSGMEHIKSENEELTRRVGQLEDAVRDINSVFGELVGILEKNMATVESQGKDIQALKSVADRLQIYTCQLEVMGRNTRYEVCDMAGCGPFFRPHFRSNEETLRMIIDEGMSLARFGDGEFSIAGNVSRQKFQRLDDELAQRIRQVLSEKNDRLIVAIADNYGSLEKYNQAGADGIRLYMTEETRALHESLLDRDRVYSDAYITRPYVMYRDNMTDAPRRRFEGLKRIWAGKRVVIVEGALTRLGVGNDLFAGAESIRRILAPATSSFDRYDDILAAALREAETTDIYLLAIGPSAGVLACDLSKNGCQAVDVGHIDLEYEWFLAGKGERVPVPNKYNNEYQGGNVVQDIHDPVYESEIIYNFS